MTDKEMKKYVGELIHRHHYYDPVEDRMEALRLGGVKNTKLLDIGSGKGHLAIIAVKKFNCDVISIDNSEEKIKLAIDNARSEGVLGKIEFKLCDAKELPFNKGSFDFVFSFNALHHAKNDCTQITKEMFRVSSNKVVITELSPVGVNAFDKYLHPEENHKAMAIDLTQLEEDLKKYSSVERFDRKLMSTFVCKRLGGIKMEEKYWLKYGFKENGDLICVRTIADSEPAREFFYTEGGASKEVNNPNVVKLTKDSIKNIGGILK